MPCSEWAGASKAHAGKSIRWASSDGLIQRQGTLVELHILLGRVPPGKILAHSPQHDSLPLVFVAEDLQRQKYRAEEDFRMGRLEEKAGTFSVFGARHIWRDGIGETAGLSHDRHGAVR